MYDYYEPASRMGSWLSRLLCVALVGLLVTACGGGGGSTDQSGNGGADNDQSGKEEEVKEEEGKDIGVGAGQYHNFLEVLKPRLVDAGKADDPKTIPIFGEGSTLDGFAEEIGKLTEGDREKVTGVDAISFKRKGDFTDVSAAGFSHNALKVRLAKTSRQEVGVRESTTFPWVDDSYQVSLIFEESGGGPVRVTLPGTDDEDPFRYVRHVQRKDSQEVTVANRRMLVDSIIQVATFPYGIAGTVHSFDLSDPTGKGLSTVIENLLFVTGVYTDVCRKEECVPKEKHSSGSEVTSQYLAGELVPSTTTSTTKRKITLDEDMYLYYGALAHKTIGDRDQSQSDEIDGLSFGLGSYSAGGFFQGSTYNVNTASILGTTIKLKGDFYLPSIKWLRIAEYPTAEHARLIEVLRLGTHYTMKYRSGDTYVTADKLKNPVAGYPFLIENVPGGKVKIHDEINPSNMLGLDRDFSLRVQGAFFGPNFEGLGGVYTYKYKDNIDNWYYLWGVLGMYRSDPNHQGKLDNIATDDSMSSDSSGGGS